MNALAPLLLVAALGVGCAPLLTLSHRDLTHDEVEVQLDGQVVGRVRSRGDLQVRLRKGVHALDVRDAASGKNVWTDDGAPAQLLVDGDVEVTLTPPELAR